LHFYIVCLLKDSIIVDKVTKPCFLCLFSFSLLAVAQPAGVERAFEAIIQEWTAAPSKKDCLQKRNFS